MLLIFESIGASYNYTSSKHRSKNTANSDDILRHTVIYCIYRNAIPDIIHYIDLYTLQLK